jgi:hypothetical protein
MATNTPCKKSQTDLDKPISINALKQLRSSNCMRQESTKGSPNYTRSNKGPCQACCHGWSFLQAFSSYQLILQLNSLFSHEIQFP